MQNTKIIIGKTDYRNQSPFLKVKLVENIDLNSTEAKAHFKRIQKEIDAVMDFKRVNTEALGGRFGA